MKKSSPALEAAEAIGSMVKQGTRSMGSNLYKKPKAKAETPKKTAKAPVKDNKPKQAAPKPSKPSAKPAAKPTVKSTAKNKDTSSFPKSSIKYNYDKNVPAVDLSFDKPLGFSVKDKRSSK